MRMNVLNSLDTETKKRPVFDGFALVCDNNPMNISIISSHLVKAGINTLIAVDGDDCVRLVNEQAKRYKKNNCAIYNKDTSKQFDLIFIAVQMPAINGLEISMRIRDIDWNVPIIAMTNDSFIENRMTYREYGIVDCLGKPIRKQDMLYCLSKYVAPVLV